MIWIVDEVETWWLGKEQCSNLFVLDDRRRLEVECTRTVVYKWQGKELIHEVTVTEQSMMLEEIPIVQSEARNHFYSKQWEIWE